MEKIVLKDITKSYGKNKPVIEHLNLTIEKGSFTVLLGPSGCGKSTILRMIAGLEPETSGEILIDGNSMRGVDPGERQIAMVFQNYALYPTMTVRENMEFGLKNMKIPKPERQTRIAEVAKMVNLEEYLDRMPAQLSGGQRQRVALARAIVKKPSVFLMDEPLSNLDSKLRAQIRPHLIELYRKLGATFVYVTHDQVEAMSMGTDIVLLENGQIRQHDNPMDLYNLPANLFSARFIGAPPMNILPVASLDGCTLPLPPQAAYVGVRPELCHLSHRRAVFGPPMLQISGELVTREMLGDQTLYKVQTAYGQVQVKSFAHQPIPYGPVTVTAEATSLYFFDKQENRVEAEARSVSTL